MESFEFIAFHRPGSSDLAAELVHDKYDKYFFLAVSSIVYNEKDVCVYVYMYMYMYANITVFGGEFAC